MKEKLTKFFETELHYVEVGLKREINTVERGNICWYAIQRGIGALTLAQMCGLSYNEAEVMFEDYTQRLKEMKDAMC